MCYKGTVWNSFKKFIGKHICRSLFLNKVAGLLPTIFLKNSPVQTFSCEIRQFFAEHLRGLFLPCDWFYPFVRWVDLCPKMLLSTWVFFWFLLSIFRANNVDHFACSISGVPRQLLICDWIDPMLIKQVIPQKCCWKSEAVAQ